MPEAGHLQKAGSERGAGRDPRIPARHWGAQATVPQGHKPAHASQEAEEEEGDSLDDFVVQTRLVPVSLSHIPDELPEHVGLHLTLATHVCMVCMPAAPVHLGCSQ